MQSNGKLIRQSLGCGYEPPAPTGVRVTMWEPPYGDVGYDGPPPTMCAGYTTSLPEVIEAAIARAHWSKGNLGAAVEGPPTGDLLDSILVLEGAYNAVQHWLATPAKDGGGGS